MIMSKAELARAFGKLNSDKLLRQASERFQSGVFNRK